MSDNDKLPIDAVVDRLVERLGLAISAGAPTGVGAPRFDRRVGVGATAPAAPGEVQWLMLRSPVLALARALGVPFDPLIIPLTTTFSAAGTAVNPDNSQPRPTGYEIMVHATSVDVQDPNAFGGSTWKAERDYYFALTSGLQCTIRIDGGRKWANDYFSLKVLVEDKLVAPSDPWVIAANQAVRMDFETTTALPFAGVTVTVNLIGVTPNAPAFYRMATPTALAKLDALGYDTGSARDLFQCPA